MERDAVAQYSSAFLGFYSNIGDEKFFNRVLVYRTQLND